MNAPSLLLDAPACCDDEKWELIPDWPHEGSTCGRVRSVDRIDASGMLRLGGMLTQLPDSNAYLYAVLLDGKRRRRVHVAVAVLEAHRGVRPEGCEACHRYGINTDNHLDGLYWGTKVQNRADRERHRGERCCDRYPLEMSQEAGSPRCACSVICHGRSVTGDISSTTGSPPSNPISPSHFTSVQPCSSSLRTLFLSLRDRQAA